MSERQTTHEIEQLNGRYRIVRYPGKFVVCECWSSEAASIVKDALDKAQEVSETHAAFLNIQADLPDEYYDNDHPLDFICLWEKMDPQLEEVGAGSYLEASIYLYKNQFYALVFYHDIEQNIISNVARVGLYDSRKKLERALKRLWPTAEVEDG